MFPLPRHINQSLEDFVFHLRSFVWSNEIFVISGYIYRSYFSQSNTRPATESTTIDLPTSNLNLKCTPL